MKISFGRHKGKPLSALPGEYLDWLRTIELREPLRSAEVAARRNPAKPCRTLAVAVINCGFRALALEKHPDKGGLDRRDAIIEQHGGMVTRSNRGPRMTATELAQSGKLGGVKANRGGYISRCPSHDDHRQSLTFTERDGKLLLHCHAGCSFHQIVSALGLQARDCFVNGNGHAATGSPKEVAVYPYHDADGHLVYEVVRYHHPKTFRQRRPDGQGGWIWNLEGVRRLLYRLPELQGETSVVRVEGEQDVETLRAREFPATTNSGGAGKWTEDHTAQLVAAGAQSVIIIPDNDVPGKKDAQAVAASCHAAGLRVQLVRLPDLPQLKEKHGEDITDWFAQGHTTGELLSVFEATPLWEPTTTETAISVPTSASPAPITEVTPFAYVTSEVSFVTHYIQYARQCTDAPLVAHEAMAVGILSAAAGPSLRIPIATSPKGWRLILWVMYLVNSTIGRKTTVLDFAKDLLCAAFGTACVFEWEGSPQGLIQRLQERDGEATVFVRDEYSGLLAQINRGGGHLAGLAQTLHSRLRRQRARKHPHPEKRQRDRRAPPGYRPRRATLPRQAVRRDARCLRPTGNN